MINTVRYGGKKTTIKDGKNISIDIPPRDVLTNIGAIIPVTITHPKDIQEIFKQQGKDIPSISINALIDTGARSSVINMEIAQSLSLKQIGFSKVVSVQDEQDRPLYYGYISFNWGRGKEIPIIGCPLKNIQCLIGRDILMHWHLTYNGYDGTITICD